MRTVDVDTTPLATLAAALDEVSARRLETGAQRARALLDGRTVWNVSTTEVGGVGELLRTLLPYVKGADIPVHWLVVDGDPTFDGLLTRLDHALHGEDGGPLGGEEMAHYDRVLARNLDEVNEAVAPGDVVVLHDPGTAGLAPGLARRGAHVVWRCHIGSDNAAEAADHAWAFLEPSLAAVERSVFSRERYRPGFLDPAEVAVIAPSIDPLSPKNRALESSAVRDLLRDAGILNGHDGSDGTMAAGGPVPSDARVVLQLSRWTRLKDMTGMLIAFDEGCEDAPDDVHLLLAGPDVTAGDGEATTVLRHCLDIWEGLEAGVRSRTHIACLPTVDTAENALLVNALQRHAVVVVQKSIAEGFGLTVAEALWKGRPVVATAVGGIRDQITDGENGLLVENPRDLEDVMRNVCRLLAEPAYAEQLGIAAHARVSRDYLSDRHLLQYVDLLEGMLGRA